MIISELRQVLSDLLASSGQRPVVAYTAAWPFFRMFNIPRIHLPQAMLDMLMDVIGKRTLLMPVYTNGYNNSVLDLDSAPATTGVINEELRLSPGSLRTPSAFFSFAAQGPKALTVSDLRPHDAWGKGSVFEWIEDEDATLLMLGVPWGMCSFLHRGEWIAKVAYRYPKTFQGRIRLRNKEEELAETLFVRKCYPELDNDWRDIDSLLSSQGMRFTRLGSTSISVVSARSAMTAVVQELSKDPFAFVKDREHFQDIYNLR